MIAWIKKVYESYKEYIQVDLLMYGVMILLILILALIYL